MTDALGDHTRGAIIRSIRRLEQSREFQDYADIVARVFGAPIALLTAVDDERLHFIAACGLSGGTRREDSFCAHTIVDQRTLIVEDATQDARFKDSALVLGPPHIRFYAGAPITIVGVAVGSLCIIDRTPRAFSDRDRALLESLARIVQTLIEMRFQRDQSAVPDFEFRAVAHDLKAPLASLEQAGEAIAEEAFGPIGNPKYAEYGRAIADGAKNAQNFIVKTLTELFGDRQSQHADRALSVDVAATVVSVISVMKPQADAIGAALNLSVSASAPYAMMAEASLRRVMNNILSNAIKARGHQIDVTIRSYPAKTCN